MAKIYDVVSALGEYTTPDGQTKTRWLKCGSIIKTANGKTKLKLDAVPIGSEGWFELMKPQEKKKPEPQKDDFDDDIPF